MDIKTANAATAYTQALERAARLEAPAEARPTTEGPSFAALVQGFAQDAVSAVKQGELASMKGISGQAEVVDVVTAVTNAEITLQTVVALRDRVVQAYEQILRMPM